MTIIADAWLDAELVRRLPWLHRLARDLTAPRSDLAADLVQDCLVRALERRRPGPGPGLGLGPGGVAGWLRRLMVELWCAERAAMAREAAGRRAAVNAARAGMLGPEPASCGSASYAGLGPRRRR